MQIVDNSVMNETMLPYSCRGSYLEDEILILLLVLRSGILLQALLLFKRITIVKIPDDSWDTRII